MGRKEMDDPATMRIRREHARKLSHALHKQPCSSLQMKQAAGKSLSTARTRVGAPCFPVLKDPIESFVLVTAEWSPSCDGAGDDAVCDGGGGDDDGGDGADGGDAS